MDMVGKGRPIHGVSTLMVLMEKVMAWCSSRCLPRTSSQRQDTELTFYFMYLGKPASVALGNPNIVTSQNSTFGELVYSILVPLLPPMFPSAPFDTVLRGVPRGVASCPSCEGKFAPKAR